MNEGHLQELVLEHAVPPPAPPGSSSVSLVRMGFPSRNPEAPGAAAFTGEALLCGCGIACLLLGPQAAALPAPWSSPPPRSGVPIHPRFRFAVQVPSACCSRAATPAPSARPGWQSCPARCVSAGPVLLVPGHLLCDLWVLHCRQWLRRSALKSPFSHRKADLRKDKPLI